jgi:hypothetical protein
MRLSRFRFSRRTALAAAGLGGVVALFIALPSRGQQPAPGQPVAPSQESQPTVQLSLPATALRTARAKADVTFTLPSGVRLVRHPRVRVVDAKDQLWELLPMYITRPSPSGTAWRELHSENYAPGTYRVRAEADIVRPGRREETVISPERTLTVAP